MKAEILLLLLPAALLFAALLLGRYPGEDALERARRPPALPPVRAACGAEPMPHPRVVVPRGGRLVAAAIAARPPPACG